MTFQVFEVGGAVRDGLLGLPVADHDWVVVGAAPDELVAAGFLPVGKDFPVFLHPETHEEYALARTERKTAKGYKGFQIHTSPDVTLEEDLARRDLTINAMARDNDGRLIDPYGGERDLRAGVLRHVSPAFVEDPVRVLRLARFAARFGFSVAPETLALLRQMVDNGEVDALVPERVWQELERGLMTAQPSRMFAVLRDCGALARILPEVDRLFGVPQNPRSHPEVDTGAHLLLVLDAAARLQARLPARFAALVHDLGKGTTPAEAWPHHPDHEARSVELVREVCQRLRIPNDERELALVVARWHGELHRARQLDAAGLLDLITGCDLLRRPERLDDLLAACTADFQGRDGYADAPYPSADLLRQALAAARAVDAGTVAATATDRAGIPSAIRAARIAAIATTLSTLEHPSTE